MYLYTSQYQFQVWCIHSFLLLYTYMHFHIKISHTMFGWSREFFNLTRVCSYVPNVYLIVLMYIPIMWAWDFLNIYTGLLKIMSRTTSSTYISTSLHHFCNYRSNPLNLFPMPLQWASMGSPTINNCMYEFSIEINTLSIVCFCSRWWQQNTAHSSHVCRVSIISLYTFEW